MKLGIIVGIVLLTAPLNSLGVEIIVKQKFKSDYGKPYVSYPNTPISHQIYKSTKSKDKRSSDSRLVFQFKTKQPVIPKPYFQLGYKWSKSLVSSKLEQANILQDLSYNDYTISSYLGLGSKYKFTNLAASEFVKFDFRYDHFFHYGHNRSANANPLNRISGGSKGNKFKTKIEAYYQAPLENFAIQPQLEYTWESENSWQNKLISGDTTPRTLEKELLARVFTTWKLFNEQFEISLGPEYTYSKEGERAQQGNWEFESESYYNAAMLGIFESETINAEIEMWARKQMSGNDKGKYLFEFKMAWKF